MLEKTVDINMFKSRAMWYKMVLFHEVLFTVDILKTTTKNVSITNKINDPHTVHAASLPLGLVRYINRTEPCVML